MTLIVIIREKKKKRQTLLCAPVMKSCCFHYWCGEQQGKVVFKSPSLKGKKKRFSEEESLPFNTLGFVALILSKGWTGQTKAEKVQL